MKACLRAAAMILLAVALLATWATAASAATYAQFNRATYGYSSTLSVPQEAGRYHVMLLQSTDAAMVPKLKAADPNLKIFVYEGIMAAQNSSPAYTTCTAGQWVLLNHPTWILRDRYGRPILYQNHYLLDVGNGSYQQTCLRNVIPMAKQGGFDGVYWDMANSKLSWALPPGASVPQYPTDSSWQAAMYSMLSYAGSQLHANGLMNVANIGGAFLFPGLWQQWNGPLDGAEEEGFTDNKQGTAAAIWAWPKQLAEIAWSEASHKPAILHSWNTTHAGNVWGLASMMLVAGGESSYSTSNGCYTSCEVWYPEYGTAQQLGAPVASYTQLSNGVYVRRYQNGIVLVNATAGPVATFPLGGIYSGSGLRNVSSMSMAPASGYILLATPPPAKRTGGGTNGGSGGASLRKLIRIHPLNRRTPSLVVTCPRRATGACTFRVILYVVSTIKGRRHTTRLGSGSLVLRPGRSGRIRIKLTTAGRRRLKRAISPHLRLWVSLRYGGHVASLLLTTTASALPAHKRNVASRRTR